MHADNLEEPEVHITCTTDTSHLFGKFIQPVSSTNLSKSTLSHILIKCVSHHTDHSAIWWPHRLIKT